MNWFELNLALFPLLSASAVQWGNFKSHTAVDWRMVIVCMYIWLYQDGKKSADVGALLENLLKQLESHVFRPTGTA